MVNRLGAHCVHLRLMRLSLRLRAGGRSAPGSPGIAGRVMVKSSLLRVVDGEPRSCAERARSYAGDMPHVSPICVRARCLTATSWRPVAAETGSKISLEVARRNAASVVGNLEAHERPRVGCGDPDPPGAVPVEVLHRVVDDVAEDLLQRQPIRRESSRTALRPSIVRGSPSTELAARQAFVRSRRSSMRTCISTSLGASTRRPIPRQHFRL